MAAAQQNMQQQVNSNNTNKPKKMTHSSSAKSTPISGIRNDENAHLHLHGSSGKKTGIKWTKQEDEALRTAVEEHGAKNWKLISQRLPQRSEVQCLHRWQKVLKPTLVKGPWTEDEDRKVVDLVKKYGAKKWSLIASNLPGRIGKQCRERWHNHLNPVSIVCMFFVNFILQSSFLNFTGVSLYSGYFQGSLES